MPFISDETPRKKSSTLIRALVFVLLGAFFLIFLFPQMRGKMFFSAVLLLCCGAGVMIPTVQFIRSGEFVLTQPGIFRLAIRRENQPVVFWLGVFFYLALSTFAMLAAIEVFLEWAVWPIPLRQYWWQFHEKHPLYFEMVGLHF
jgi:hypothetical protein